MCSEPKESGRNVVHSSAYAGDLRGRTLRCVSALVLNNPIAERIAGNNAKITFLFALAGGFLIWEEIQTILENWPADRAPEDVANQFRGQILGATLDLSRLHEIVIGAGLGVAEIFVERTVKLVRAAFCNQRNLGTRRTSRVGPVIGCGYSEFLHRIESDGKDRREG